MSKAIRLTLLAPLALVWISVSAWAQSGVVNSTKNAKQTAILHWYDANQTTSFAVGNTPAGVAFDGANIWVAKPTLSNNLIKFRASDGQLLGTFTVGTGPAGVAFDGANIWVTNVSNGSFVGETVTKLRASDGQLLGTFSYPAGASPATHGGLAFDGANIWVTNLGNSVSKLRASDGQLLGTFSFNQIPSEVDGVAFDG